MSSPASQEPRDRQILQVLQALQALQILTPTTPPAPTVRTQRHAPRPSQQYRDYRDCLRWDAGFTCCYCLVHETDLSLVGVHGHGLTSIEHIQAQVAAPHLVTVYGNLAYACFACNNTRRSQPAAHPSGARLLDPWRDAWGEHFVLRDDRLEPRHDDERGLHACYTERVYRLNDRRKVERRRLRREFICDRLECFEVDAGELRRLAMKQPLPADRERLLALVARLRRSRQLACDELAWRAAIPCDAPRSCRCGSSEHHSLPPELPVMSLPAS